MSTPGRRYFWRLELAPLVKIIVSSARVNGVQNARLKEDTARTTNLTANCTLKRTELGCFAVSKRRPPHGDRKSLRRPQILTDQDLFAGECCLSPNYVPTQLLKLGCGAKFQCLNFSFQLIWLSDRFQCNSSFVEWSFEIFRFLISSVLLSKLAFTSYLPVGRSI